MEVTKTLLAGKNGTKRYLREYGDNLYCVRYRQDKEKGKRYTTVELIVDEGQLFKGYYQEVHGPHPTQNVDLQIGFSEFELRDQVKAAGARWDKGKKLWELPFYKVKKLGLESRMINMNPKIHG